jgi:hypothetical protein
LSGLIPILFVAGWPCTTTDPWRKNMRVEEFESEFLSLPEEEQMIILRKILPAFCRTMTGDPKKVREMFSVMTEECAGPVANMIFMTGMMGRKGEGCCG